MFNLLSSKQMEGEGDKNWKMLDPTFEGQWPSGLKCTKNAERTIFDKGLTGPL